MHEVIALHSQRMSGAGGAQERREQLGRVIRLARGSQTQAHFGAVVGVRQPAVSGWETGRVTLTSEQLLTIEESLGLEHGWLSVASGYVDPEISPVGVLLDASLRLLRCTDG